MFRDPLVLDVLFLLHIGKGLIFVVTLSVVVPQAIGSFLRNRIGDSVGDVPYFYLGLYIGTMGLILMICSLFLPVSVSHFIVCLSIDTPLYWFGLDLLFTTAFFVYAFFWQKVAYIRGFLAKSHVHMQLFFKQSHTSSPWLSLMLWEVAGWVVSVVGSSLGLMLSVGCFFCDQRQSVLIIGITSILAYRLGSPPFAFCMTL